MLLDILRISNRLMHQKGTVCLSDMRQQTVFCSQNKHTRLQRSVERMFAVAGKSSGLWVIASAVFPVRDQ